MLFKMKLCMLQDNFHCKMIDFCKKPLATPSSSEDMPSNICSRGLSDLPKVFSFTILLLLPTFLASSMIFPQESLTSRFIAS